MLMLFVVHGIIEQLWPTLTEMSKPVKPYLADAAAAAWYADTALALASAP